MSDEQGTLFPIPASVARQAAEEAEARRAPEPSEVRLPYRETSREAYEAAPTGRRKDIFELLQARGPLTDWEIHEALGCPYTGVQGARGLLVKVGLIEDSGVRRRTAHGARAIVWRIK